VSTEATVETVWPPSGCAVCGVAGRRHQWADHEWARPDDGLVLLRMKARRGKRLLRRSVLCLFPDDWDEQRRLAEAVQAFEAACQPHSDLWTG
jgi:hypothetical protein